MTDTDPPESNPFLHHLLFSDPIQILSDNRTALNSTTPADYSDSFYGPNPPKMLCFGGYKKEAEAICSEITAATFKQMVCQSESSSASSANNNNSGDGGGSNPNRKRIGTGQSSVNAESESKRGRSEKPAAHAKPRTRSKPVRKEKIGERVAKLQQLITPFGKTDTASVLEETHNYIKFLHDQIQVLSTPYLNLPPNQKVGKGLRGKGLCLVPVALTAEVANSNGADYWAPAGMESRNSNMG